MKRISYLETCHPRNLLSRVYVFVLRLDSRLRGNDSVAVSLHASRFTRYAYFIVFLFSLHASLFTLHAQAKLENGMDADVVIGQPDFTTVVNHGRKQNTLHSPANVFSDGKRLFVADHFRHAVLVYNKIPTTNFEGADVIIGLPNFTASGSGTTATTMNRPDGIWFDGKDLFISEFTNNRVLVYHGVPKENGAAPNLVLGQPDFTTGGANTGGLSARSMNFPRRILSDGQKLFVADYSNNRVLIYHSIPKTTFAVADQVLGQPDFVTNSAGTTNKKFTTPAELMWDGKRLIIVEAGNNRVLIYNKLPKENFAPADVVIGQINFESNLSGLNRYRFNSPNGGALVGERLFIVDTNNNRIMVWNKVPKNNYAPANHVIGQPDFSSSALTPAQNRFSANIFGMGADGKRIYAPNFGFGPGRVLIFDITSKESIDLGPQFSQGKAVVGKVFWDFDGDGRQDA